MTEANNKRSIEKLNNQIAKAKLSNGGIFSATAEHDLSLIISTTTEDASGFYEWCIKRLSKLRIKFLIK